VAEECVWGREGNNHILLPVNSDIYKEARLKTDQVADMISLSKLEIGDVVKFDVDSDITHVFMGKMKAVWEIHLKQAKQELDGWSYRYYRTNTEDEILATDKITDTKFNFVFMPTGEKGYCEYKSSGKCMKVGKIDNPEMKHFSVAIPKRVYPDGKYLYTPTRYSNGQYNGYETVDFIKKVEK